MSSESFTSFIFDSSRILNTTMNCGDDPDLDLDSEPSSTHYSTCTVQQSRSSRQTTSLEERPPRAGPYAKAVIDWKKHTFQIAGATQRIEQLRKKRAAFSSSRYWSWFPEEEYRVKFGAEMENTWSVYSYDGSVLATFNSNMPILQLSPNVTDDHERQFLILILLYSETKRLEGIRQRPMSIVADITSRRR
ncbi:hypothetical protein R3P38DRAFT_2877545 [Favolaschia claudopus]|uniref:Uncharacterized protein n=1 Tax=Favolaschia claudopus TaxID=2862362 RepID=A0AAW0D451_9AGAR